MCLNTKLSYLFFFNCLQIYQLNFASLGSSTDDVRRKLSIIQSPRAPIVQFEVTPLTLVGSSRYFIVYDNLITR